MHEDLLATLTATRKTLTDRQAELWEDWAWQGPGSKKYELWHDIEKIGRHLEQIDAQLNSVHAQRVYNALIRLNYYDQHISYGKFRQKGKSGLFLIRGDPEHGQRWLLNRLLFGVRAKHITVDLRSRTQNASLDAVWRQLAGKLALASNSSPSAVIDAAYNVCTTQNLLLIFHYVDFTPESYVNDLVSKLWSPLASRISAASAQSKMFDALMFLVDYQGREWNVKFTNQLNAQWNPTAPVALPVIERFTADKLFLTRIS